MDLKLDQALNLAMKKIKEGSPSEARHIYQSILAKFPANKVAKSGLKALSDKKNQKFMDPPQDQQEILFNLYAQGQLQKALGQADELLNKFPHSVVLFNFCGVIYVALNQYDAGIDCYNRALKIKPNFAQAHNNIGIAFREKGELATSIGAFKQALKLDPTYAAAHNNLGISMKIIGELDAAIECYEHAIKINLNYPEAYNNMGNALSNKGDLDKAIDCYKKALKVKPEYAVAKKGLGAIYQGQGDLKAAAVCYEQALEIKPDYFDVHRSLSTITSYSLDHPHLIKMQKLCKDTTLPDHAQCKLNFALAKAYEDTNDIKNSFQHLTEGNAQRTKILGYNIQQDKILFSDLKKSQPSILKHTLKPVTSHQDPAPIFILGMPRSGTTLVEQIISSHSEVTAAGELREVSLYGGLLANGSITTNHDVLERFRQKYLSALSKRSECRPMVTDKMPQNFRFVPLICAAFPEAKIIHIKRDAAATCWSNYQQYFATKDLGYCYNLENIVAYYRLYWDLMRFWNKVCGDRIYTLDYEKLTNSQELETKKLIHYLDLDWQDECLSPHMNTRAVKTASQQQVRKKVYQGSSQKWLKYEPFLNGAFDGLTELNGGPLLEIEK